MSYTPDMTKLSEIDEVLIRFGDTLSAEEISFKIEGILTPVQVAARLDHLVAIPDRLSALQQDQLITLKMRRIISELEGMPRTTRNAEVILNGLEKVGKRLDKRVESTEKELHTLYAFQGGILLDAIKLALTHMRGAITDGDPQAEAAWDKKLEAAMRFAQVELAKHEIEE